MKLHDAPIEEDVAFHLNWNITISMFQAKTLPIEIAGGATIS